MRENSCEARLRRIWPERVTSGFHLPLYTRPQEGIVETIWLTLDLRQTFDLRQSLSPKSYSCTKYTWLHAWTWWRHREIRATNAATRKRLSNRGHRLFASERIPQTILDPVPFYGNCNCTMFESYTETRDFSGSATSEIYRQNAARPLAPWARNWARSKPTTPVDYSSVSRLACLPRPWLTCCTHIVRS